MNILDVFFHYYGAITAVLVFVGWLIIKLTLMHLELRKVKSLLEQLIKQKSVPGADPLASSDGTAKRHPL